MNISLTNITDPEIIKYLLFKDNLYKGIGQVDTEITLNPDIYNVNWYQIIVDDKLTGLIFVKLLVGNTMCFHGGAYKAHRGENSGRILKECLKQLRNIYKCTFVSTVPESNRLAANLLKKAGLIQKTIIINGYKKSNMILFGEE